MENEGMKHGLDDLELRFGIILNASENKKNYWENLWSIGIPLFGTLIAMVMLPWHAPSLEVIVLAVLFSIFTTLGTTVGLHRYFTHRSYKTSAFVRLMLALAGTIAFQGSIIRWVADHRRHHRFTDQAGDLHSPYFDSDGKIIQRKAWGFCHSHVGWMFTGKLTNPNRYARDLLNDPVVVWFSDHYFKVNFSFLVTCGVFSYTLTGSLLQAVLGVCYIGCFRAALIHQFTWAVNSIGHMYGTRVAESKDFSTNNVVLAILTIGDGLHSSHHANPARGVNPPTYLDLGGALLRYFEKIGMIWNLRR